MISETNDKTKMPIGIYQIDKWRFEKLAFEEITELIIQQINSEEEDAKFHFKKQTLAESDFGKYEIKVFHAIKSRPPKWRSFFKDIITKESALTKSINTDSSFIAFIGFKKDIFGISGGHGNFNLPRYAVQDFGMEILVRLIKKDHRVIKGLQDRGVTGNVLGQTKFYRGDQRFADEDQFGKIYRQVKAELNKEILTKVFGFSEKELKRKVSGCLAKSSFQINKSIDFKSLLNVISKFSEILDKERNFSLNKVTQIQKRSENGKKLIADLENQLISELHNSCNANEIPDFDFCHKDFESYFTARCFKVKRDKDILEEYTDPINLEMLIADLKKDGYFLLDTVEQFKYSFLYAVVQTFDENEERLTSGFVLEHLHGELLFEDKTYFYIDGDWYLINPDFITDLNKDCEESLNQTWDDKLLAEVFDIKKSEKMFNSQFIGKENFLVFDTITPENIELCDILKYTDDSVYLIHVKKGFNNSVRELVSQITIAARRVLTDIKSDYSFINLIEQTAKKGKKSQSDFIKKIAEQNFPDKGLKSLFTSKLDRNIVFCLAFVDIAATSRSLKNNVKRFQSNIAKFSILELRKEINSLNFGIRIIQLQKKTL